MHVRVSASSAQLCGQQVMDAAPVCLLQYHPDVHESTLLLWLALSV